MTDHSLRVHAYDGERNAVWAVHDRAFRASPVDRDPGTAEVRSLRVDPAFQGRGYGRRLVRALEDRARAAGFERVVLDTNVRLTGARELYESLGYEEAGRESLDGVALVYYERSP